MPDPANPSPIEWELLLACCALPTPQSRERIHALARNPVQWPSLIALADQHGVSSLLYRSLAPIENSIPADQLKLLQQRYQTNLHKALLVAKELIRILDRLDAENITVMPYKGVALAETGYGDIALRQPGDIDLLIRPGDFAGIKTAVSDLGYTPHAPLSAPEERAYLRSGYECAFDSPAGRNLLEVQWALQPLFYAVDFDMEKLFSRMTTVTVAGRPMHAPAPEDLLIVLSLHAAKHAWNRLIWLCDIARLMTSPTLRWDEVFDQARTLGIVRILVVSFLLANRLLEAPLPDSIPRDDPEASTIADEIVAQIMRGNTSDTESLAYFRLMLRLRERTSDRICFLQRLALTPGPGEWSAIRLPAGLFPLYRIVRLGRLAARLARL